MRNKKSKPSREHHWWPITLAENWSKKNEEINRVSSNGEIQSINPKRFAYIVDGHNIILGESSPLNQNFEQEFKDADGRFSNIIHELKKLTKVHIKDCNNDTEYLKHNYDNEFLNNLCHSIVSLLVRAPMTRNEIVGMVEAIGTPMSKKDLKTLSAANMTGKLNQLTKRLKDQGKFVILFSKDHEFIYGDGFYHNISMSILKSVLDERILLPLTPHLAVMYVNPIQYMSEQRLMTLNANHKLVMLVNQMVQIYSKDYLFYKSERPNLIKEFLINKHLVLEFNESIENLFNEVPGCFKNL